MLIIGLGAFGDETSLFNTLVPANNFERIEVTDVIIDEIYMGEETDNYNTEKQEWGFDTVLIGKFAGSLECGNVENRGMPIEKLVFKKRLKTELEWQDMIIFDYDLLTNIYSHIDYIVQSTEEYEYMIAPYTSGVMGTSIFDEILCAFDGTFIVDKEKSYQIVYDLEYGNITYNIPHAVIETFSPYPTTIYSGQTKYKSGNIQALILSSETVDSSTINARQERLTRDDFLKFINDKKPKILKDYGGRHYMISIFESVESPKNELGQAISNISFSWVECGDANNIIDLINNGFIEGGGTL